MTLVNAIKVALYQRLAVRYTYAASTKKESAYLETVAEYIINQANGYTQRKFDRGFDDSALYYHDKARKFLTRNNKNKVNLAVSKFINFQVYDAATDMILCKNFNGQIYTTR